MAKARKVLVSFRIDESGLQYIDRRATGHDVDRTLELAACLAVAKSHELEVDREVARRKARRTTTPT